MAKRREQAREHECRQVLCLDCTDGLLSSTPMFQGCYRLQLLVIVVTRIAGSTVVICSPFVIVTTFPSSISMAPSQNSTKGRSFVQREKLIGALSWTPGPECLTPAAGLCVHCSPSSKKGSLAPKSTLNSSRVYGSCNLCFSLCVCVCEMVSDRP